MRVTMDCVPGGGEASLRLRCSVTDTGVGIPADVRERIFEPFVQTDDKTTRRYGGNGLGLAICSQLVEMMSDRLTCESNPHGKGTRFSFDVEVRGVESHAVENGRMAIDAALSEPWDLVLMDLHMPEADGLEATAAIRASADGQRSVVPIVAMTARSLGHGTADEP